MLNLGATTTARSTADPVVTDCATTDVMAEILSKSRDEGHGGGDNNTTRQQDMTGFKPTFVDIVDYILRTTHWIWNEKKVELCHDYYSKDCLVHTLTGDLVGNQAVADDLNDSELVSMNDTDDPNVVKNTVSATKYSVKALTLST